MSTRKETELSCREERPFLPARRRVPDTAQAVIDAAGDLWDALEDGLDDQVLQDAQRALGETLERYHGWRPEPRPAPPLPEKKQP